MNNSIVTELKEEILTIQKKVIAGEMNAVKAAELILAIQSSLISMYETQARKAA